MTIYPFPSVMGRPAALERIWSRLALAVDVLWPLMFACFADSCHIVLMRHFVSFARELSQCFDLMGRLCQICGRSRSTARSNPWCGVADEVASEDASLIVDEIG